MKKWDALFAAAGLVLFAFAVSRIGWASILHTITEARIGVVIILCLGLARCLLQTRSWSIALRAEGVEVAAGELMVVRLASQGMGYLSVLGPIASEPMKIALLKKEGGSVTTSTLADSGVYWFTSGITGIAGCMCAVLLSLHRTQTVLPLVMVALLLVAAVAFLASPTSQLSALADGLGEKCPRWLKKAGNIEAALRQFASLHPSLIRRMFWLDVACQVLLGAEVVAILWCLKIPVHAATVLGIEAATRMIKIVAGWMPARIGVDESGLAGAFLAFGLSPAAGLTLALARRTRDLLAALIGVTWLVWSTTAKKEEVRCAHC